MSVVSLSGPAALSPPQGRSTWKPFFWYSAMLLLLALQLLSGTSIEFALLVSVFCLLVYASIMACGGLATLVGLAIFNMALQHVFVAEIAKLYYWQAADTNLVRPMETMLVYDVGMLGIFFGCLLSGRVAAWRKRPVFDRVVDPQRLMWLAYISTAFAIFVTAYIATQTLDSTTGLKNLGGIHGLADSLSYIAPLSVATGTAYMILSTHGKRSLGFINAVAIAVSLAIRDYRVRPTDDGAVRRHLLCHLFSVPLQVPPHSLRHIDRRHICGPVHSVPLCTVCAQLHPNGELRPECTACDEPSRRCYCQSDQVSAEGRNA